MAECHVFKPLGYLPLALQALVVGLITGIGAVVFRGLIGLIHNLLFLGKLSFVYNASLFTPADPLGRFVILVPVIGGLGVTWIVSNPPHSHKRPLFGADLTLTAPEPLRGGHLQPRATMRPDLSVAKRSNNTPIARSRRATIQCDREML